MSGRSRIFGLALAGAVSFGAPAQASHSPNHSSKVEVAPTSGGFATGIFIPGGGDGGDDTRKQAASCQGCSYVRVPSCDINGFLGYDPDTGEELWENGVLCPRYSQSCANGGNRWDIYLRRPGESTYRRIGSVCLLPGQEIVSGAQIAAGVRERFEDAVPTSTFAVQPSGRQVVNIPTIFYVDEQPVAFPPHSVAGITVQIHPKVDYYWRYEPGGAFEGPTDAGAPYPDQTVTHTYASAGARQVTLRAVWTATFTVFGRTFDVPGQVVRESTVGVDVHEARATLHED